MSTLGLAATRIGHDYSGRTVVAGYEKTFSALLTQKVAVIENRHEIECNLDLLRAIGLTITGQNVSFVPDPSAKRFAKELLARFRPASSPKPVVGLHVGSSAAQSWKRWPLEKYGELADRLARKGFAIILLGGSEERQLNARLQAMLASPAFSAVGELSLHQSAAVIAELEVFVGNDSGLAHVAAAVGTPVVGIYGPTQHERTAAWGRRVAKVYRELECSGCYVRNPCAPENCEINRECLTAITVDQVEEEIASLINTA